MHVRSQPDAICSESNMFAHMHAYSRIYRLVLNIREKKFQNKKNNQFYRFDHDKNNSKYS